VESPEKVVGSDNAARTVSHVEEIRQPSSFKSRTARGGPLGALIWCFSFHAFLVETRIDLTQGPPDPSIVSGIQT
jgi:hypothetical protein